MKDISETSILTPKTSFEKIVDLKVLYNFKLKCFEQLDRDGISNASWKERLLYELFIIFKL